MANITRIASSSSSSNSHIVYEVFLNHRGPDIKKNLASHIYHGLKKRGLNVFFDQPELEKGKHIVSQIQEAIRTSSVHLALFSPTYAQSHWCLDELALMVESGSTIIPVFIDVDPSELRWTRSGNAGSYAQDLQKLESKTTLDPRTNKTKRRHDSANLERWRDALQVVSKISGFRKDEYNGDEGLLVDAVVEKVCREFEIDVHAMASLDVTATGDRRPCIASSFSPSASDGNTNSHVYKIAFDMNAYNGKEGKQFVVVAEEEYRRKTLYVGSEKCSEEEYRRRTLYVGSENINEEIRGRGCQSIHVGRSLDAREQNSSKTPMKKAAKTLMKKSEEKGANAREQNSSKTPMKKAAKTLMKKSEEEGANQWEQTSSEGEATDWE